MEGSTAFIIDWIEHPSVPGEVHALALVDDGTDYRKALVRVVFPDYFYLLLAETPGVKTLETLRHKLRGEARFSLKKVKTLFGYQPSAEVPALFFTCNNIKAVLKNPAVKALGGKAEEVSLVDRSRKLTASRHMSQCCWISLAGASIIAEDSEQRLSKPGVLEYKFDNYEDLIPLTLDRKEHFAPPPGSLLKTFSFDIEVYKPSTRGGGMPDPKDPDNIVLCISYVVDFGGPREHVFLTISDVPDRTVLPTDTKVKMYSSEKAMIYGFFEDMAKVDPMIVLGFNNHSWDFRYLHDRLVNVFKMSYPLSLGIYKTPIPVKMRHSLWKSEAFRYNDIYYPIIPGILFLDLHKFFTRTRPKLKKHSLEFISRTFLGVGKYDITQERMVNAYEGKDPRELSLLAQYNIQDSVLVADLFLKNKIFEEAAIEALVCETLIDDMYTKGMTIRALNQIYRYAKEDQYVLTDTRAPDTADHTLIGAYVTDPTSGLYDDTAVYDIQSMYPSIMIMLNLCYSTYIRPEQLEFFKEGEYITLPWETKITVGKTTVTERHEVHFVTDRVRVGTCKRMLSDQVAMRNMIRGWSNEDSASDDSVAVIMKMIQKAVKMASNSLIGLMAAPTKVSALAFHACAGAVYTRARETIVAVIEAASNYETKPPHGPVIYSDTDSLMIANMGSPESQKQLLDWLNKEYAPLIFEFENVGRILLLSSKNYIMRTASGETRYVGVAFTKRTTSAFISHTLKEIVTMILNRETHDKVREYAKMRIKELPEEDPNDLAMTATVSEAQSSIGTKLAIKSRATSGVILQPGDTVDYLILKGSKKKQAIGERAILLDDFFKQPDLEIDYSYYEEHLLAHLDRLLV